MTRSTPGHPDQPGRPDQNTAILDQFAKQAESYGRLVQESRDPLLAPLLAAARPLKTDRLLDVACGTGRLILTLAELVGEATGIDLTPQMLSQARALQAERKITNVRWLEGDVLPLPFADNAYTLVGTSAAFHHMTNPAAVFAEMIRVCAPRGRIILMDLSPAPEKAEAFNAIEHLRDPSHVRALPPEALRALGRAHGLKELAFETCAVPFPLEAILATSFPGPGALDEVRRLYKEDARDGGDRHGLKAKFEKDAIIVHYPTTLLVWRA